MNTTAERLAQYRSAVPSRWRGNTEARLANQEERRKARKIAMKILNALDKIEMTPESLAEKLGISYETLLPILKGHRLPSDKIENQINLLLGLT